MNIIHIGHITQVAYNHGTYIWHTYMVHTHDIYPHKQAKHPDTKTNTSKKKLRTIVGRPLKLRQPWCSEFLQTKLKLNFKTDQKLSIINLRGFTLEHQLILKCPWSCFLNLPHDLQINTKYIKQTILCKL